MRPAGRNRRRRARPAGVVTWTGLPSNASVARRLGSAAHRTGPERVHLPETAAPLIPPWLRGGPGGMRERGLESERAVPAQEGATHASHGHHRKEMPRFDGERAVPAQ